jgi:hypothetical protein
MTVYHPTRRWVKQVVVVGGNVIEQCDGDGEGGGGGGDGDDDSMDDDENDTEVLEENRSGPEEEEMEEFQDPFQEDHVEVTDFLYLLNRSVTLICLQ